MKELKNMNFNIYTVLRVILCGAFGFLTVDFGLTLPHAIILILLAIVMSAIAMYEGEASVRR